ncbi:MAG: SBBP repeat-containing protein [Chloroflexota bacterium]
MPKHFEFSTIRSRVVALFIAFSLMVALLPLSVTKVQAHTMPTTKSTTLAAQQYGALPLSFMPNFGQTDSAVHFQTRAEGGTLFFTPDEVVLSLSQQTQRSASDQKIAALATPPTVVRLRFAGANPAPVIAAADRLPGIVNSFIGNDPSQWHTNIPTYAGVNYHNLYPGIDLHYDGHAGLLKGTYTVAPGADPTLIRWQYNGATTTHLDSVSGNLLINLPDGKTLTEQAPVAWQDYAGQRLPVAVHYRQSDSGEISFVPADYDAALPLVIDPSLTYSTYLGGSGDEYGNGITVDSSGNAYVTGYTYSTDFPTANAFQIANSGGDDAFVTKLNAAGSALVYSTYLGGTDFDDGIGIAVDSSGNAYVTGFTQSTNFPTTAGAYQTVSASSLNAFVTKLNAAGSALVYSTYLGGNGFDVGKGIAVDSSGNAYVTGYTYSTNFPTANAFQIANSGGDDAFVTKLNAAGSALVYSTYLGGTGNDEGNGIAVDSSGNAYVTGYTSSTNFPTANAFQIAHSGGTYDVFVTKLNAAASALVYSTYLGGNDYEYGQGIAVDSSGNAYVMGFTQSTNFPTTAGAYQTVSASSLNAFVTKLNAAVPPSITSANNTTFAVGSAGTFTVTATGSPTPTFSATGLPAWATLNATSGVLSGTPPNTTGSPFAITITAVNGTLPNASQSFTLTVTQTAVAPVITSATTTTFAVGSAGTFTVTATGNPAPTFSATGLPAWATLNATSGILSGTPPSTTGTPYAVTITASNGTLPNATQNFTLKVGSLKTDTIGVYRTSNGTFYLRNSNTTGFADITTAYGSGSILPVTGDWNGDGIDTIGTYNTTTGLFSLKDSNSPGAPIIYSFVLGASGDQPMAGDWNNNGQDGVGVFRPSNGLIYLKNNLTTGFADFQMVLGVPSDVPLAGDWNGDGKDSPGVYRPSTRTFFLTDAVANGSATANYQVTFGVAGDSPFAGDWNGDGTAGIGVFRPSNGQIYLRNTLTTGFADLYITFGISNDKPIAGHWAAGLSAVPPTQPTPKLAPTFVP